MKRQKAQRTWQRYTRQDGCILVQDIPYGADSTQPGLPRPALPGEVNHLRALLLDRIAAGERSQRLYTELFAIQEEETCQNV